MKKLSFLIPTYQKEKTIVPTLLSVVKSAQKTQINYEIIVIDDGSKDSSFDKARSLIENNKNLSVIRREMNLGFATTYFECAEYATGSHVMYISADDDYETHELVKLLEAFKTCECVIQYPLNQNRRTILRLMVSSIYTGILNFISCNDIPYYNGANIYPIDFIRKLEISDKTFNFQARITLEAIKTLSFCIIGIDNKFNDVQSSLIKRENIWGALDLFKDLIKNKLNG